jgi:tRNA nucleotidyltransferase/poly(A) polymerase
MDPAALFPPGLRVLPLLTEESDAIWLVGGAPRDFLLQRTTHDFDFVVQGEACRLARRVANALGADYFTLDAPRDVGRVIFGSREERWTLDFARLRGAEIEEDLRLRDFTINAIALALQAGRGWLDPLQGAADLKARRLRLCSPQAMRDDPVRTLRAIRFSLELGLRMDSSVVQAIREAGSMLPAISAERVRDEVFRLFSLASPAAALRLLDRLGVLGAVFPEMDALRGLVQSPAHDHDAWEHTLAVVDGMQKLLRCFQDVGEPDGAGDLLLAEVNLSLGRFRTDLRAYLRNTLSETRPTSALLFFSALYHDVGKAVTRTLDAQGAVRFRGHEAAGAVLAAERAAALRLSKEEIRRIEVTIAHHMRPSQLAKAPPISRRNIYRYFRDCGPAGIDIALLSLADLVGKVVPPVPQDRWRLRLSGVRQLLEAYFEHRAEQLEPSPLVGGEELMSRLGLGPGPQVGQLLEAIREAQAAGEVTTVEQAFELAASLL